MNTTCHVGAFGRAECRNYTQHVYCGIITVMSGIYLTVWDNAKRDASEVLKPTRGGWPHITFAYTGKHLPHVNLVANAHDIFDAWEGQTITLTKAIVNSFEDKPGHMRHDVLLQLDKATTERFELERKAFCVANAELSNKFGMVAPHVTHAIYETRKEAEQQAQKLNAGYLPHEVEVIGVSL